MTYTPKEFSTLKKIKSALLFTGSMMFANIALAVPAVVYNPHTATFGSMATITPVTFTDVDSCAMATGYTLPSWASLNTTTCVISGTPDASQTSRAYRVTATSATAVSKDFTVNITVIPAVPVITYADQTLTVGTPATITPTINLKGGSLQKCELTSGTLPAGLTLNAATCVVSGTPRVTTISSSVLGTVSLQIRAKNQSGYSASDTFTVSVDAAVPELSYVGASGRSVLVGQAMRVAPTTLKVNDEVLTGCALASGMLPAGLSLNATTCVISGTPTAAVTATAYTINATNSVGDSADAAVTLTVGANVPVISYAGATGTALTVSTAIGSPIAPTTLTARGAAVSACNVSPALPPGLSINATTCAISGTPTVLQLGRVYKVTAVNSAGNSTPTNITLSVSPAVPTIAYADTSVAVGTALSLAPTLNAGGGSISNCRITGTALPTWARLNTKTCVITGTPTAALSATTYSVIATNAGGDSATDTFDLTVTAAVPLLNMGGKVVNGQVGTAVSISPASLAARGAAVSACAATPALPGWASINATTCVITGTPTATLASTSYSIAATNSVGDSVGSTITLKVIADVPTLTYTGATLSGATLSSGVVVTTEGAAFSITPAGGALVTRGAAIDNCSIRSGTRLPTGITINATTCVISGTPASDFTDTTFRIAAHNARGFSAEAIIHISADPMMMMMSSRMAPRSVIYAATARGLSISSDGGESFINRDINDGLASDRVNAVAVSGSGYSARVFAATDRGLSISNDGGRSFSEVKSMVDGMASERMNSVTVVGHGRQAQIYVGSDAGLSVSRDGGQSWSIIDASENLPAGALALPSLEDLNLLKGVSDVFALAFSGRDYVLAASQDGLQLSSDGGKSFSSQGLKGYSLRAVSAAVHAKRPVIFAGTDQGLMISNDGGRSFNARRLDRDVVNALAAVDSEEAVQVYAATSAGLSISKDGGESFESRTTQEGLGSNEVLGVVVK